MEDVDKAIPAKAAKTPDDIPVGPSAVKDEGIRTRIADNLRRVEDMLNVEKAEEYGDPRIMFRNISKRWFDRDDAEADAAIMMAELKIERIKYDHGKEDSYLDAIAYLAMALSFMQERKDDDQ